MNKDSFDDKAYQYQRCLRCRRQSRCRNCQAWHGQQKSKKIAYVTKAAASGEKTTDKTAKKPDNMRAGTPKDTCQNHTQLSQRKRKGLVTQALDIFPSSA